LSERAHDPTRSITDDLHVHGALARRPDPHRDARRRRLSPRSLRAGDVVTVAVDGIGRLENPVAAPG
jgi:2-keto-4-pentenoate hydratase/2-oxohepta-3-ene-1,7-dioic acid hydratase in catechol pathway